MFKSPLLLNLFKLLVLFQVNLEKVQERWWEAVFVDEPKLSVRKMECSRPMTDLDDEAQTKIEQMMYDDHRKKLGLPTHEEQVGFLILIIFTSTVFLFNFLRKTYNFVPLMSRSLPAPFPHLPVLDDVSHGFQGQSGSYEITNFPNKTNCLWHPKLCLSQMFYCSAY